MKARSIKVALLAVALATVPCTSAWAAEKKADKPMVHPKPAPEIAKLKFFDGSWSCSGEGVMEPGGPAVKMTSSVKSHSDLGGFWQSGMVKGGPTGAPPFEGMFHMTWDPAAKQYLMLWVDSMGGWSQMRSSGWEGDKIVFTGDTQMGTMKMRARDTFTRRGASAMTHLGEGEVGGKWTKMLDETCRKGGGAAAR
jgi:uncharacterized protein DUF1579